MAIAKDDFGVAIVDNRIYAIGGMTGPNATPLDDSEVYDPERDQWATLPPLPSPRRAVRAAAIGENIYIVGGGREDNTTVTTVNVFNTTTQRWFEVAPLPTPLESIGLVAIGGSIFAIGGLADNGTFANAVFVFDPKANTWSRRAPMPTARSDFGAVLLDGRIYAIGGVGVNGPLASVERYDPGADAWDTVRPLPEPMVNLGAAVVSDQIHALLHFAHYVYAPETNLWSKALPMFLPRHGFGIAALNNNLYTIGGCHMDLFDTRDTEEFTIIRSSNRFTDMRVATAVLGMFVLVGLVLAVGYGVRRIWAVSR